MFVLLWHDVASHIALYSKCIMCILGHNLWNTLEICFRFKCKVLRTHSSGVGCIWTSPQHLWQAKVSDFTDQVTADLDVTGSQILVDISKISQVCHTICDPMQKVNQLDDSELPIMSLYWTLEKKNSINNKNIYHQKHSSDKDFREKV